MYFRFRSLAIATISSLLIFGSCVYAAPPEPTTPPEQPTDQPAQPSKKPRERLRFGPDLSLFRPSDARVRNRFGSNWQEYGPGIGTLDIPRVGGDIDLDYSILTNSRGKNSAALIPVGLRFRTAFGEGAVRPYLGTTLGMLVTYLRSPEDNLPSRLRSGFAANVSAGLAFGDKGTIQVGYQFASRVRGFDFSGASVGCSYRF